LIKLFPVRYLSTLLLIPVLLLISCREPAIVENGFTDSGDSITVERKQTIVYDNGERVEIRYLGSTLEYGKYKKSDPDGNLAEEGEYINGGFRKAYGESNVRGEALLAMILFALFIYLVYLYFKYRQVVIDWHRVWRRNN
jgi:hypothetical protein